MSSFQGILHLGECSISVPRPLLSYAKTEASASSVISLFCLKHEIIHDAEADSLAEIQCVLEKP
jgi:hypothetical protein